MGRGAAARKDGGVKVTRVTSKELLIAIYGLEAVQHYEAVKAGSMHLGHQLAKLLLRTVGGRPGRHGEPFDGLTTLGQWEFCLSRRAKNSAGNAANLERAPNRCVQILEEPRPGWISAEAFLEMHGQPAAALLDALDAIQNGYALHEQLRLGA